MVEDVGSRGIGPGALREVAVGAWRSFREHLVGGQRASGEERPRSVSLERNERGRSSGDSGIPARESAILRVGPVPSGSARQGGAMGGRAQDGTYAQQVPPKLRYSVLGAGGSEPRRSGGGDVGYDLTVARPIELRPFVPTLVEYDIAIELPPGVWAWISPRSSTLARHNIHIQAGIIDNGYRGPLRSVAMWMPNPWELPSSPSVPEYHIDAGDRLAQLILMRMAILSVEEVDQLSDSERGQMGFGSTGR